VSSNDADNPSDAYVMPSATIWTTTNSEYPYKSLKVMVDAEGFEPTTR